MTSSPLKSNLNQRSAVNKRFSLPEPDRANITVLTNILPNNPVLPWNHYDSPWLPEDAQNPEGSTEQSQAAVESPTHSTGVLETASALLNSSTSVGSSQR